MGDVFRFIFLVVTGRWRPAFELLRHLRLGTQLAFVGLGVGSYTVHQYPDQIYGFGERGYLMARLSIAGKGDGVPLSTSGRRTLDGLIQTLRNDLTVELLRRDVGLSEGYNTWQVAQTVVALGDKLPASPADLRRFFDRTVDPACKCWRETPEKQPHTGATGWALYALAQLDIAAPSPVLSNLLTLQSRDGWWPLYPARVEPRSASTYATAWATTALCAQLPLQIQAKSPEAARIEYAVRNALNWLAKNELARSARWHDYPAGAPALTSVSISGHIVHLMKACRNGPEALAVRRRWLSGLPLATVNAADVENSNISISLANGSLDFDRTRHYPLQWGLIATVDAFGDGSLTERAAALQWIERILRPELINPAVRNQAWVAAELLFALRYLEARLAK